MKRIILFGLILVLWFSGLAQNPTNYQYRAVRERSIASMLDSTLHLPRYNTTPSGLRVGSSANSGAVAIDTINHVGFFYSGSKWRNFGSQGFETRLVNGGKVNWDSLLVFSIAPAIYYINGAYYTSSQTYITLDAADGSDDRIDLIYLDSTGVHSQTGVPSGTPQEPSLPANSIRLTAILVPALATSPGGGIDTLTIYDENVEWTGSSTSLTAIFDDNIDPFHLIKDIQLAAITNASIMKLTSTTTINVASFSTLRFFIKLKGTFSPNTYWTVYFVLNGAKTCIPIEIKNGTYGFSRTNTTTYQQITIPISDFAFTNSLANGIWFQPSASNSSGLYFDWIQLQGGIAQPSAEGISNAYTRMTDGTTTAAAAGQDIFKFRANSPLNATVSSNDATHGDNVLMTVDTSRALAPSLATNAIVKKQIDSLAGLGSVNIYNTDGSLTGNRTVTLGTNSLSFTGSSGIIKSDVDFRIHPSYTSNYILSLATIGNGTSAKGSLVFRDFSTGGGNTVELTPVDAITSSYTLNLPEGNDGDTIATKSYARKAGFGTQGDDIASVAGAISLGAYDKVFEVTGTNAITLISNAGRVNGSEITLIFTSTASLTDGTANSGTDIGMELAGNANFSATADDTITLILCEIGGTQRWREKCRSVN